MLNIVTDLYIPSVPNFIKAKTGGHSYEVGEFTDAQLRVIGGEWTLELIENAKRQRMESKAYPK